MASHLRTKFNVNPFPSYTVETVVRKAALPFRLKGAIYTDINGTIRCSRRFVGSLFNGTFSVTEDCSVG
jgi:hypothetical protein